MLQQQALTANKIIRTDPGNMLEQIGRANPTKTPIYAAAYDMLEEWGVFEKRVDRYSE
jgi:hypothetical protein